MSEPRFVGLDVHKDVIVATTVGPSGLDWTRPSWDRTPEN